MGKFVDITGMEFGNWKVLRKSADRNSCGQVMWVCQCKCGAIKEVSGSSWWSYVGSIWKSICWISEYVNIKKIFLIFGNKDEKDFFA